MKTQKTYQGPIDPSAKTALQELQTPGEPDLWASVVEAYLEGSESFLNILLTQSDLTKLSDLGHSWKSSSATVGAVELAELCQELESHPERRELVQAIENEYKKVKIALKTP